MYSSDEQLIEFVRILQQKGHIFAKDPKLIDEQLQHEQGSLKHKFYLRASRIDVDGKLQQTLTSIHQRMKLVVLTFTLLWFVFGFVGLWVVMQAKVINFFYVLYCVLGFHSVMLIFWFAWLLVSPKSPQGVWFDFFHPATWIRQKDGMIQSAVALYQQQLQQIGFKWYLSYIGHQFWLASLLGMLTALVLMLLIKQYHFIWESTLLDSQTVIALVKILSFLPESIGFATPSVEDIITTQFIPEKYSPIISFRWAMLLISSVILYGIFPRGLAWLFCWLWLKQKPCSVDFKQPYYQKIVNSWQKTVIDSSDDFYDNKPLATTTKLRQDKTLVVLLEYPFMDKTWYQCTLGQTAVEDFGVLDGRDDMARLTDYLTHHSVQVLLGVVKNTLPDRGVMRQLDKIAQLATGGLMVQFLAQDQFDQQRLQQWQSALAERQIAIATPYNTIHKSV